MIRVYNTKEDEVFNIPLTPEAARSPQILSSFMKRSQTLSHDPFFFYTAFHDSCRLSIRKESAVRFHCCGSRAPGREPVPSVGSIKVVQCVPSSGSSFRPMSTREFRVSVSARGSPLQRAPSPCNRTSIREPCYTLRPARGSANFCYSCRSRSATCNFSGRGYMYFCQRSSKYSQYIYSSRTGRSRWAWPPLATHQSFAQEKTASEASQPVPLL